MKSNLSKVIIHYPEANFDIKEDLVDSIVSKIKSDGNIDYSGYQDEETLKEGLLTYIGNGDVKSYKQATDEHIELIKECIKKTIEKCNQYLPVPAENLVYVHPYLPTGNDKVFEGVMAVAVYSCVFHLFIDSETFTQESLEDTVAHELNHTIYYYHHYDDFGNYSLLDNMLLEGLAENFKEEFFRSQRTAWAGALKKEEALESLKDLDNDFLLSTDQKIIQNFLFGNSQYKKWSGYSLGYWIVKEYISHNPNKSWEELAKTEKEEFLK